MLEKSKTKSRRVIDEDDISGLFGIEMEAGQENELKASDTKKTAGRKKRTETKKAAKEK